MQDIILYILIISVGYFITKKGWIPKIIDRKVGLLQTLSLFFLLGVMGYKIGSDDKIIANFHILGLDSVIVAVCAVLGSILLTHIFYRGGDK